MKKGELVIDNESLESLSMPVFVKNTDGVYIYCNNAFASFLGISKNEIIGHNVYDIAPRELADIYTSADKELLSSAGNQIYDSTVKAIEAETSVVFRKSVIYTPQHELAGFLGSIEVNPTMKDVGQMPRKKLTAREIDVLNLLIKGSSAKSIARALGISTHTVADHLKSIYIKLDAHSKNEALYKALTLFAITP